MAIKVRYENNVFKILGDAKLEHGIEGSVKITKKKDILKIAKKFSGIGGYKKKITAMKLRELEEEMHG